MRKKIFLRKLVIVFIGIILIGSLFVQVNRVKAVVKNISEERVAFVAKKATKTKVVAPTIVIIDDISIDIIKGDKLVLPNVVVAVMSDKKTKKLPIKWITAAGSYNTQRAGTYTILGKVAGYSKSVRLTLTIREVVKIDDFSQRVEKLKDFKLPDRVSALMSDGAYDQMKVVWDANNPKKIEAGLYEYYGKVNGYSSKVKFVLDRKLPDKVEEIINRVIKKGMSAYEKEIALHDYLVRNTVNDLEDEDYEYGLTDYGVLVMGKGINYPYAFQRLLNEVGIENRIVEGEVKLGGSWYTYYWNMVELDGDYYHVDIAIDDIDDDSNSLDYSYFNVTDEVISQNHRWSNDIYPACNSVKYWYLGEIQKEINIKVASILSSIIKPNMTPYQKEIAIHNYLILNAKFDSAGNTFTGSIGDYGVLVKGRGTYYSQAFNRLLSAAGIECKVIYGEVLQGDKWVRSNWNLVKLEDDLYHVDVLWDDYDEEEEIVDYNYLNLNDEKISKDHRWDVNAYPKATSLKYWYFTDIEKKINGKVESILRSVIKPGMTDFEKELAIHDYIIKNTSYEDETSDEMFDNEFSDYSTIVNGYGTYYSEAYNRLLRAAGVECKLVVGEVYVNNKWVTTTWNMVKLDGNYYHVDVLWDDDDDAGNTVYYDYFNLDDTNISKDHRWSKTDYPVCNSLKYLNYNKKGN